MFDFNDFNRDDSFYNQFSAEPDDMGDFTNTLMIITSVLKNLDFDSYLKSGHELMMKIFNMTSLEPTPENEQALNVVMSLIAHIYAMLGVLDSKEEYFEFFDNTVMYPMINGGK